MPWCVDIYEFERGWGYKLDETIVFNNDKNEASEFTTKYNSSNTETVVPDWYMVAHDPYFTQQAPQGSKIRFHGK